jgi:hypothetical protein
MDLLANKIICGGNKCGHHGKGFSHGLWLLEHFFSLMGEERQAV